MLCKKSFPQPSPRGNALLFLILAIATSGIATAMGVQYYKEAESLDRTQKTISEIIQLIGNARATFGPYKFQDLDTPNAIKTGVIPESRVVSEDGVKTAINAFGGGINIMGYGDGIARLGYASVPSFTCQQVIHGTHHLARAIRVGYMMNNVNPLNGTVDLQAAALYCSSEPTVPIYWIFGVN